MKYLIPFIGTLCFACSNPTDNQGIVTDEDKVQVVEDTCQFLPANANNIICPDGQHTDSIVPIIYGYPSEEMFNQSDSGLIMIGGCEVSDCDPNWWCKIHEIGI